MKLNIECQTLQINRNLSLEENGLIGLLNLHNNRGVVELSDIIGANDGKHTLNVLQQLVNKNLFYINETNENDSLVINIINEPPKKDTKLINISKNKKLQLCYQLNETKLKSIMERSSDSKSFKYNLVSICYENYTIRKLPVTEVNSQEDFVELMYAITPFETILTHDKKLTRRDFDQIFDLLSNYEFDMALINFAIDYAISTSKYHNLSYEFVMILLDSWKKHKITDVNGAVELIKLQKEASITRGTKYVAPTYEQPKDHIEQPKSDIKKLFTEDDNFE